MVRINLVALAERRRLLEHEHVMSSIAGVDALTYGSKTARRVRLLLVTRVRSFGWTVARAAAAAGVTERSAFRWLSEP